MQRKLTHLRRSDEEAMKEFGLLLDIDEIARRGSMSAEEGLAAKWHGIHAARQAGNYMVRVVLPGGVFTSAQARVLAKVAEDYAQGRIALTTRQSIQLHWLKLYALPLLFRDLARAGLSCFHGSGDVTRAVVACPRAAICPHRRLDVLPYAKQAAELLTDRRDLDNLPRKLKLSFSGCGAGCAQPMVNCLGITALVRAGEDGNPQAGFRVLLGGGLGSSPQLAQELFSFVPQQDVLCLCAAMALFFRDQGDRYNRAAARLKFVVREQGIDRCRHRIMELFASEGGDPARLQVEPTADCGEPWPARPLAEPDARGTDGLCIQPVRVPTGELRFRQLRRLAELSEMYADKHLYITNRQNFELHGVQASQRGALIEAIRSIDLDPQHQEGLRDVVACVGTTYCSLAITRTRDLHDLLSGLLAEERYASIAGGVIINIAGCPNSCAPYAVADIGLRGMRIREAQGSVEAYQLWVGGDLESLGQQLGAYKTADVPTVVRALLDTFLRLRSPGEALSGNLRRLGVDAYREAVRELGLSYQQAPAPRELSVKTGSCASPLDLRTVARDLPCQQACPARTNIPAFVRQVALGNFDEAYRINQEANVLPGVLGRICTRPCEGACRQLGTGTHGSVAVCHLKRSAADGKTAPAAPLEPWFGPSGRRVAIIGGGPAGLAASRELRRFGHGVTLFDREPALGGMLRLGIPAFRLPREVVDEEVGAVVAGGVELRLGQELDGDGLRRLAEEYDAVLLAVGATRPLRLELPGLPEAQAMGGLEFVKQYNTGGNPKVAGDVLIIGGGFTAVDCARVARRLLGAGGRVRIMYRRTEGQMSASPHELWQLRLEGIELETLVSPVAARLQDGKLAAVRFQRNVLGEAPDGDKPPFAAVPGSEHEVPCGTLIFAIGQDRALEILPPGVAVRDRHTTSDEKLFLAGDFSSGSLDVVHAVADGKAAAEVIDRFLTGQDRRRARVEVEVSTGSGRLRDHDLATPVPMPVLPVEQRQGSAEVERGFTAEAAHTNAWRCYQCDHKYEIDQDRCIHCNWCLKVSPRDCIRQLTRLFVDEDGGATGCVETTVPREATFVWIDSDRCIRCGNCLRICPVGAISCRRLSTTTQCG